MKSTILLSACILSSIAAGADAAPEGWAATLSREAAESAESAYTNDTLRCVWAGDKPNVASALPANVPFHFLIAGELSAVSNVQKILDATCAAIPQEIRTRLQRVGMIGPTLQWFTRFIRCNSTEPNDYLRPENHPAVFRESDFNPTNLPLFASQLRTTDIPPAAALSVVEETYRRHLTTPPAMPGVDFPGVLPETTYATPFGVGMVLRAPQSVRFFRVRAQAWPNAQQHVTFCWKPLTGCVSVSDWHYGKWPRDGYGLVRIDRQALKPGQRADVAVFAKGANGLWGAPSILSFYASPYETRVYANGREIREIRYSTSTPNPPPYDLTELCPPAQWIDYYLNDEKQQIFGFNRQLPDRSRPIEFSNRGEIVLDHYPNDTPKRTRRVRYYLYDGTLRFEKAGEPVDYRHENFHPIFRGE